MFGFIIVLVIDLVFFRECVCFYVLISFIWVVGSIIGFIIGGVCVEVG